MSAAISETRSPFTLPRPWASLRMALRHLAVTLARPSHYRPERHYMRGGRTEGSRSLAMARARIAGQG